MTQAEEIDMLRRAVADLTERVRTLEARPMLPYVAPATGAAPCIPTPFWVQPIAAPRTGDPMPLRPLATCVATSTSKGQLWQREA